jgi:hypothetical protein
MRRRRYTEHPLFNPVIERLYLAFDVKPLPDRAVRWLDMPPAEFETRGIEEGSHRRVYELNDDIYEHMAWHAMCWDADHRPTLWYFLPRILDELVGRAVRTHQQRLEQLSLSSVYSNIDLEMLAERLRLSSWLQWPEPQRQAVEDVFVHLWRWSIDEQHYLADLYLELLLVLEFDPVQLLKQWLESPLPASAITIANFALHHQFDLINLRIVNWKHALDPEAQRKTIQWLISQEVTDHIESAFFKSSSEKDRADLSLSLDVLSAMRGIFQTK